MGGSWLAALPPMLLVAWMAWSGAQVHPDYLTYFNEFAGERPEAILVDSDLDWWQDMALVSRRLREMGVSKVWLDYYHSNFATPEVFRRIYGLPGEVPAGDLNRPEPGWHAIGLTTLRAMPGGGEFHETDASLQGVFRGLNGPWYQRLRPRERVGGWLLFYVPPDFAP
jgi:hypothetical protein